MESDWIPTAQIKLSIRPITIAKLLKFVTLYSAPLQARLQACVPANSLISPSSSIRTGNKMTWRRMLAMGVVAQQSFVRGIASTELVHHVALQTSILPQRVSRYPCSSLATSLGLGRTLVGTHLKLDDLPCLHTHQLSRLFQTSGCSMRAKAAVVPPVRGADLVCALVNQ